MYPQYLTPQNNPTLTKHNQNSYRNSLHSTSKQRSHIPSSQKQSDSYSEDSMEKYNKTYFKSKINQINQLKFTKTKLKNNNNNHNNNQLNSKSNNQKIKDKSQQLDHSNHNLQKIDEKNHQKYSLLNQDLKKIHTFLFPQSPKSITFINSPKIQSPHLKLKYHQHNQSNQPNNNKNESFHQNQPQQMSRISLSEQQLMSNSQFLQPSSLKKKINLIKKHKQILQNEFHRRRASLQFKQRTVTRQEKKVSAYRSKFQKIINARHQRSLQRNFNERQIQQHDKQIMQQKYYLRSTVLNTQDNLQSSRLSLCVAKMNLANETRVQKRVNMQEVSRFEHYTLSEKKRRCDSVKSSKMRTQQCVDWFNYDKRMTINQRKLQQISQQLISLQQQRNRYSVFYKQKDENELYKSRIKQKKEELQKKAKLYKINLMLELNRNDRQKIKNQQQDEIIELKNSTTTQLYRKKRHTVSTEPDLNLLTTAKNNSIYKRWGNSIISSSLNQESTK